MAAIRQQGPGLYWNEVFDALVKMLKLDDDSHKNWLSFNLYALLVHLERKGILVSLSVLGGRPVNERSTLSVFDRAWTIND